MKKQRILAYVVKEKAMKRPGLSIEVVGHRGKYPEVAIVYGTDVVCADVSPDGKTLWIRTYHTKEMTISVDFRHKPNVILVKKRG